MGDDWFLQRCSASRREATDLGSLEKVCGGWDGGSAPTPLPGGTGWGFDPRDGSPPATPFSALSLPPPPRPSISISWRVCGVQRRPYSAAQPPR